MTTADRERLLHLRRRGLTVAQLLVLLGVMGASGTVVAQTPPEEQVRSWLTAQLENAEVFPDLNGSSIAWIEEHHFRPPAAELERLQAEIRGKPDHPERENVEAYLRRAAGQPDLNRFRLWTDGSGRWRLSHDFQEVYYWDTVLMPGRSWMMLPHSLTVLDPSSPPPSGMDVRSRERSIGPTLGLILSGGFTHAKLADLKLRQVDLDGEKWTAIAARESVPTQQQIVFRFAGSWDPKLARGFVDEVIIIENAYKPESVGQRDRMLDWQFVEPLGIWAAAIVERFTPAGQLDRRLRFVEAEVGSPKELDLLTQIPSYDGSDPIRGASTFTQVQDYRRGVGTVRAPDGALAEFDLPNEAPRDQLRLTRIGGWIAALVVVLVLAVAVVRRQRLFT